MPAETPPPSPAAVDDAPHLRTAWHPLLVLLLELLLPKELWRVVAEYPLTREPRRIDALIIRRVAEAAAWHADHLRSVLDDLHEHNIVHFKGATDALERADALQLLSYAYQYMILAGLTSPSVVALRVVAPNLTPRFHEQLETLGGVLSQTVVRGVHVGTVQGFALRVVETSVVWPNPGEQLLYAVSPQCLRDPALPRGFDDKERELYYRLLQGIAQFSNDSRWNTIMKDANFVSEATAKALRDLLDVIPPEQRLAGLAPEQRLAGLAPEQRLAGLAPEQRLAGLAPEDIARSLSEADHILALPDAALRALPADYLATLPEAAQERIRVRLGR